MSSKSRGNWPSNFGESKIQGQGEIDKEFSSMMDNVLEAIKAGHLPPSFGEGLPRALKRAKQKGMVEILETIEVYEQRLKNGELGESSGVKVAAEIRDLVNGKVMGVIGPSFF